LVLVVLELLQQYHLLVITDKFLFLEVFLLLEVEVEEAVIQLA
jgi:hypothetical protein